MSETKTVWSRCNECARNTYQEVIHEFRFDSDPNDYRYTDFYMIIRCNGCRNVSYRTESHEVEHGYDEPGLGWQVPVNIDTYPHRSYKKAFLKNELPDTVRDVYDESVAAYEQGAFTLTGVGLRATIEAICNEQDIKGKNLESRINKLSTVGHISKNDAKRLHAIRFLGNDAAHKVVKPKKKSIEVAIKVIEHLFNSIYILDNNIANNLDNIIDEFGSFEALLKRKVIELEHGAELPVKAILEKEMRRIDRNYDFTTELHMAIKSGDCKYLSIGKNEKYNNSNDKIQHYILNSATDDSDLS